MGPDMGLLGSLCILAAIAAYAFIAKRHFGRTKEMRYFASSLSIIASGPIYIVYGVASLANWPDYRWDRLNEFNPIERVGLLGFIMSFRLLFMVGACWGLATLVSFVLERSGKPFTGLRTSVRRFIVALLIFPSSLIILFKLFTS